MSYGMTIVQIKQPHGCFERKLGAFFEGLTLQLSYSSYSLHLCEVITPLMIFGDDEVYDMAHFKSCVAQIERRSP